MASRVARKLETKAMRAANWHDGQITKSLSSPSRKNIPLPLSGRNTLRLPPSCPARGALAIVANEGQGAMDAKAATDAAGTCVRRKRLGPTPRCWRQVGEELTLLSDDGGKKAGHQDEIV